MAEMVASQPLAPAPVRAADSCSSAISSAISRSSGSASVRRGAPRWSASGPGEGGVLSVPPPTEVYSPLYWRSRFPALLVGLRHRMGEEALHQAVEELLSRRGRPAPLHPPGAFEVLARHGGPDLPRFLRGQLREGKSGGSRCSKGSSSVRGPDGWRATGRMHNRGDAQALCKVVLTTDLGPVCHGGAEPRAEGRRLRAAHHPPAAGGAARSRQGVPPAGAQRRAGATGCSSRGGNEPT